MQVRRFAGEYELLAAVYGRSPEELQERDRRQGQPLRRWLAVSENEAVGAVSTWWRPDDRLFLYFVGDHSAIGPLTDAVVGELGRDIHAFAPGEDLDLVDALEDAGFEVEVEFEDFRIDFDPALAAVQRAWLPEGITILSAREVDEDRLFQLDNRIRRRVPGTDRWQGDREWFREELAESPPFDPSAYLVAIDDQTGEYAGLIRIWRNPSGPRFGLIGVLPEYRGTPLAPALLKRALKAASRWGHDSFVAEVSPSNTAVHRRMVSLGAESRGRVLQLRRPHSGEIKP